MERTQESESTQGNVEGLRKSLRPSEHLPLPHQVPIFLNKGQNFSRATKEEM